MKPWISKGDCKEKQQVPILGTVHSEGNEQFLECPWLLEGKPFSTDIKHV